jgi:hypothetical protein
VSGTALALTLDPERDDIPTIKRAALSHRIREVNDFGREPPLLTTYALDELIANSKLPKPAQQATNIIRFIGDIISETGEPVADLPASFHASVGSPSRSFAMRIAAQLVRRGLLTATQCGTMDSPDEIMDIDLTLDGWERYQAEKRGQVEGGYGFIALQFGDPVLDTFLKDVIKPAVADLGYVLEDMRDAARVGVIDNVIRARIRDAAFVLVDLTHANRGAYWEAGYAEGLGKPVLYICERKTFQEKGTHFDTNHCTTVM